MCSMRNLSQFVGGPLALEALGLSLYCLMVKTGLISFFLNQRT